MAQESIQGFVNIIHEMFINKDLKSSEESENYSKEVQKYKKLIYAFFLILLDSPKKFLLLDQKINTILEKNYNSIVL